MIEHVPGRLQAALGAEKVLIEPRWSDDERNTRFQAWRNACHLGS